MCLWSDPRVKGKTYNRRRGKKEGCALTASQEKKKKKGGDKGDRLALTGQGKKSKKERNL